LGTFPIAAQAANPPIRFQLSYGHDCISGTATPGTVSVWWGSSVGTVKGTGVFEENGSWTLCATETDHGYVEVGDMIQVGDGTTTRNYVVPDLTVTADRVSGTFHGTGPAGRTITVGYASAPLSDFGETHYVRVAADGTWSFDPEYVYGGMYVELFWKSPNNDFLDTYTIAPTVTLTLGKASFTGQTGGAQDLSFALRDATTNAKLGGASAFSAPDYGYLSGTFRDSSGHALRMAPGQRFKSASLSPDADFIVPNIDGSADKATETVTGRCYDAGTSAGLFSIFIYRTGHARGNSLYERVDDADGNFSVRFTGRADLGYDPANIKSGDRVEISCLQETGDWIRTDFRVP
jgi:hypothetical protein